MAHPAIRVVELGKQYHLGARQRRYRTLRDSLQRAWYTPVRIARSVRRGRRHRESFWALRDINFDVRPGEVLGIIGRNGAGKSTLLKILSRITEPTAGHADIHGRMGSLLEVGTGFHPELTGAENIFLNGAILGLRRTEIQRRFDDIVAFAEVERFIHTPVKHYSSGMYLRLAFAVAAHLEPEILVVDEVLAVGDAQFQQKCIGRMQTVAGEGRTVLFVSHNMAAVSRLCSRTVVLDAGRIAFDGATDEGIRRYTALGATPLETSDLTGLPRRGTGGVRLTRLRLRSDGHDASAHVCGAPLELAFRYEMQDGVEPRDLSVQVRFLDDYGDTILTLWNKTVERERATYPRCGWLTFAVERLPLRPGLYPLSVWVKSARGVEDWLDRAAVLDVSDGDFFGTGRMPPKDTGLVLTPHVFTVLEDEA